MKLEKLKLLCLEEIDKNKEEIISIGKEIYCNPELGYKEEKTTKLASEFLAKLGLKVKENIAVTGCIGIANEDVDGPKIAVFGELDSIVCSEHNDSNSDGIAHACGHNIQIAGMLGCALGLIKSGVIDNLDGKVDFIAVPSEELIDIEYRRELVKNKEIMYMSGKQELIRRGYLDDVDMAMMFHSQYFDEDKNCIIKTDTNGTIAKSVTFEGRSSHAGGAPHLGVNALNAAQISINAINSHRETFEDKDKVRISYIITKGGDSSNVVPSVVKMDILVRASNKDAMIDANEKVNRCLQAGALSMGANVIIEDIVGYMPMNANDNMGNLLKQNYVSLLKEKAKVIEYRKLAGSTDFADVSYLMPCVHPWIGGLGGRLHTKHFSIEDEELAYIVPAKVMAMTIIDILGENANKGKRIISDFKPLMTKDVYLEFLNNHTTSYEHKYLD